MGIVTSSVWLAGEGLINGTQVVSELQLVLGKLGVTVELKDISRSLVCMTGNDEGILLALADIAKAQVFHSFWLVGSHLLNGGQNPNKQVTLIFDKLGITKYSVITFGEQPPMIKFTSDDKSLVQFINLIAESQYVC